MAQFLERLAGTRCRWVVTGGRGAWCQRRAGQEPNLPNARQERTDQERRRFIEGAKHLLKATGTGRLKDAKANRRKQCVGVHGVLCGLDAGTPFPKSHRAPGR
jgi:hypothetical protein